ncbi:MAG: helix-turn-helix domain-containing protein [Gemmatimonadetes bacterium]|nr:helix-turn-helix domain-containing protein [Gemmatimonadota bacterium]
MPTLAALLKEEIGKIVRKEVQAQMRDLNKTVRGLEKQLGSAKAKPAAKTSEASAGDKRKQLRISPNTIKKHRKRLKLSQADLGKLLNVSTNTVLRWEAGSSKPRGQHLPGLAKLRTMSKRELKEQLGE